jgi:hypothetical protein
MFENVRLCSILIDSARRCSTVFDFDRSCSASLDGARFCSIALVDRNSAAAYSASNHQSVGSRRSSTSTDSRRITHASCVDKELEPQYQTKQVQVNPKIKEFRPKQADFSPFLRWKLEMSCRTGQRRVTREPFQYDLNAWQAFAHLTTARFSNRTQLDML